VKVGDLVKFSGVVRSRTEPRVYDDDDHRWLVGIIIEIKDTAKRQGTCNAHAHVMWNSGEIGVSDLYNLERIDDESR